MEPRSTPPSIGRVRPQGSPSAWSPVAGRLRRVVRAALGRRPLLPGLGPPAQRVPEAVELALEDAQALALRGRSVGLRDLQQGVLLADHMLGEREGADVL